MDLPLWVWFSFIGAVLGVLALDLGVFHRKAHEVSVREAGIWSSIWIALGVAFGAGVWLWQGAEKGLQWFTGYVVEYSLAVDNIFVFVMVFASFAVPAAARHRVLFWGVIGALVMRGVMIVLGAELVERFHWIMYVFGAFLVFTGIKMLFEKTEEKVDLEAHFAVRLARRLFRVSPDYDGQKFFTVRNGMRFATPLLIVLVFIEVSDLIFAVDSIPAIFAITTDPFIVFTSNVMAILGLRSLYFLLAHVVDRFVYLKTGLSFVLAFIGAKLLLIDVVKIPITLSLGVIVGILGVSVIASLIATRGRSSETPLKD